MSSEYNQMIDEFPEFINWKKRRSRYYFQNSFLIFISIILIFIGLVFSGIQNLKIIETIFIIIFCLIFLVVGIDQMKKWIKSKSLKINEYWFGTATAMYRNLRHNKKVKNYRIVADVEGKVMEGICLLDTYKRIKIGDRVLLFTIGNETIYCIHLEN